MSVLSKKMRKVLCMSDKIEVYEFIGNDEKYPAIYSFISVGVTTIKKIAAFETVEWAEDVVNFVLADEISPGEVDAERNSNNGDIYSVLHTCAAITRDFISKNPNKSVYIKGSDDRRERTYQRMLIRQIQKEDKLTVLAQRTKESGFEPINKDLSYVGFLVISKS
ncbi:MAG: hypothetical protein JWQ09_3296 [Segetibacter sp.]|nr:hypothetical protein [Segetibacter sp.]